MTIAWGVYRQDFNGNKFTIGVLGVYVSVKGDHIKVLGLSTEQEAIEAAKQIDDSHFHPHKAYYFPFSYEVGQLYEVLEHEHIEIS